MWKRVSQRRLTWKLEVDEQGGDQRMRRRTENDPSIPADEGEEGGEGWKVGQDSWN